MTSLPYPTPPPTSAPSPGYYAYGPTGEAYYFWPSAYGTEGSGEEGGGRPRLQTPPPKTVKKRVNNNNKERKRTRSINAAFCLLRSAIPQIPADTKLSKIKTLKLATSYIVHLMDILEERKSPESFGEDIIKVAELTSRKREAPGSSGSSKSKKISGRTGWPQHVWSLELKTENPSQQT